MLGNECKGACVGLVGFLAADVCLPDLAADLVVYEIQARLRPALNGVRYWH